MNNLYYINTPIYCVGVIVGDGIIIDAPPIVRWGIGKGFAWFIGKVRNTYPTVNYQLVERKLNGESA